MGEKEVMVSRISKPQYNYVVSMLKELADRGNKEYESLLRTYVQKAVFDMDEEVARVPLSDSDLNRTSRALKEHVSPEIKDYFGDVTPAFDAEKEELKRRFEERRHVDDPSRGMEKPEDTRNDLEGRTSTKVGEAEDDSVSFRRSMGKHASGEEPELDRGKYETEDVLPEESGELPEEDLEEEPDEDPAEIKRRIKERKKKEAQKAKEELRKKQAKEFYAKKRAEALRRRENEVRQKEEENIRKANEENSRKEAAESGTLAGTASAYDVTERQEEMRREYLEKQKAAEKNLKRHTDELSREAKEREESAKRFSEENARRGAQYDIYSGNETRSEIPQENPEKTGYENSTYQAGKPKEAYNGKAEQDQPASSIFYKNETQKPSEAPEYRYQDESPVTPPSSYGSRKEQQEPPAFHAKESQNHFDNPEYDPKTDTKNLNDSEPVRSSGSDNTLYPDSKNAKVSPDTASGYARTPESVGSNPNESHYRDNPHREPEHASQREEQGATETSFSENRPDSSSRASDYESGRGRESTYEKSVFEQNQAEAREDDLQKERKTFEEAQKSRVEGFGEEARNRARSADEYARTHSGSSMQYADDSLPEAYTEFQPQQEERHYRENDRKVDVRDEKEGNLKAGKEQDSFEYHGGYSWNSDSRESDGADIPETRQNNREKNPERPENRDDIFPEERTSFQYKETPDDGEHPRASSYEKPDYRDDYGRSTKSKAGPENKNPDHESFKRTGKGENGKPETSRQQYGPAFSREDAGSESPSQEKRGMEHFSDDLSGRRKNQEPAQREEEGPLQEDMPEHEESGRPFEDSEKNRGVYGRAEEGGSHASHSAGEAYSRDVRAGYNHQKQGSSEIREKYGESEKASGKAEFQPGHQGKTGPESPSFGDRANVSEENSGTFRQESRTERNGTREDSRSLRPSAGQRYSRDVRRRFRPEGRVMSGAEALHGGNKSMTRMGEKNLQNKVSGTGFYESPHPAESRKQASFRPENLMDHSPKKGKTVITKPSAEEHASGTILAKGSSMKESTVPNASFQKKTRKRYGTNFVKVLAPTAALMQHLSVREKAKEEKKRIDSPFEIETGIFESKRIGRKQFEKAKTAEPARIKSTEEKEKAGIGIKKIVPKKPDEEGSEKEENEGRFSERIVGTLFAGQIGRRLVPETLKSLGGTITEQAESAVKDTDVGKGASITYNTTRGVIGVAGALYAGAHFTGGGITNLGKLGVTAAANLGVIGTNLKTYVTGRDFAAGSSWQERKNAFVRFRHANLDPVRKESIWKVVNSYASGEKDFRAGNGNFGHFSKLFRYDGNGKLKRDAFGHVKLSGRAMHSEIREVKNFLSGNEELKAFLRKNGVTLPGLLSLSPEKLEKLPLGREVKDHVLYLKNLRSLKSLTDTGNALTSAYSGIRRTRRMDKQFQSLMAGEGGENGAAALELATGSVHMVRGGLKAAEKTGLAGGRTVLFIGDHTPGIKQMNETGRKEIRELKDRFAASKRRAKEAFRRQIMDTKTGLVGQVHGGLYNRITKGKGLAAGGSKFAKASGKPLKSAGKVTKTAGRIIAAPFKAVHKTFQKVGQFFSFAGRVEATVKKFTLISVGTVFIFFIMIGTLMAVITYVWSTLSFDEADTMQKFVNYTTKTVVKDWKEGTDDKKEVNGRSQNQKELYDQGGNETGRYRLITTNYVDKAGNKIDANDNAKDVLAMTAARIENDWPTWLDSRLWPWNWFRRGDFNDDDENDMSVHLDTQDVKDMIKGLYLSSHSWEPKEIGPYIYYKEVNHASVTLLADPSDISPDASTVTKQLAGDAEGEACRGPRTFYCLDAEDAVEYSSPYRTEMIKSYATRSGCEISFKGNGWYNAGTDMAFFNEAGTKKIHLNRQDNHAPYETTSVSNAHAEGWVANTDESNASILGSSNDIASRYARAEAIKNAMNSGTKYEGKYIISGSGDEIRFAHGLTDSTKTVHDKTKAPAGWQHYTKSEKTGYLHASSSNGRYKGSRKDGGDTLVSSVMKHGKRTNAVPSGCASYDVEWNSWDTEHICWSIDGAGSSVAFTWNAEAGAYEWSDLSLGQGTYDSCPYSSIMFYRINGAYYPEGTVFSCNEEVKTWQCSHPTYDFTCEDYEAYCNGHREPMLIYYCPGHEEWYCDKNHYDLEIDIRVDHLPNDSSNFGGKEADPALGIGIRQADGSLTDIPSTVDDETDETEIMSKMAIYYDDMNSTFSYHRKAVSAGEDPRDDHVDNTEAEDEVDDADDSFHWSEENRSQAEVIAHADWHEMYPDITGIEDTSVNLEGSRNFLESYERRYIDHHFEAKDDSQNYMGTDGKKHALDPEDPYTTSPLGVSTPNFLTDAAYDDLSAKEKQKYTVVYDLPEKEAKLIRTGLKTVGKIAYYEHGFASQIGSTSDLTSALVANGWGTDTAGYTVSTEDGHGLNTAGYVTWLMAYCGTPIQYENGTTVLTPDCRVIWNNTDAVESEDDLKIGDIGFINSYDNRNNIYDPGENVSDEEKEMYEKEKEIPYNAIGIFIGKSAYGQKMWLISSKSQGMVSLVTSDAYQYFRRVPAMQ